MPFPSTFESIQDRVIAKIRFTDSTANRDLVKDWINIAYAEAVAETQALQKAGYSSLVAGSGTYAMPSEIIELTDVIMRDEGTSNASGWPLRRVSRSQMLSLRRGQDVATGSVSAYALLGLNQIEFYPIPTSTAVVQFYYIYLPDALSDGEDVPDLQEPWGSRVLEYGALVQAAELRADPLLEYWDNKYQDAKMRLRVHMNRRGGVLDQFPRWGGLDGLSMAMPGGDEIPLTAIDGGNAFG